MKKKKSLKQALVLTTLLGAAITLGGIEASAHGYVESPKSRGYQGKLFSQTAGWSVAHALYGNAITGPQSFEWKKGYPESGPRDEYIASAEGELNHQIGDRALDKQKADLWPKTDISAGPNTFTWHYTAEHSTAKWHYYITKPNWNPNAPLTRASFEKIGEFKANGEMPSQYKIPHTVNIPKDRSGYHVILAVWDVADTENAFYNVIDVNIKGGDVIVKPDQPKDVKATNVAKTSVSVAWSSDAKAKEYNIYRNGKKIATSTKNEFKDTGLKANTTYQYEIEAIGNTGLISEKSKPLSVTTKKDSEKLEPTAPSGLHTMAVTTNLVDLMWKASEHESGIKHYEIYRDGKKMATSTKTTYIDNNVAPGTTYTYKVRAISNENTKSKFSNEIKVTTESNDGGDYPEFKLGTFPNPILYNAGQKVSYKGKNYEAIVTHNNYGDDTWVPGQAVTLFREI